ncbi:Ger(x)C family spore germination protein [Paenibacillus sp. YSY-4.3]
MTRKFAFIVSCMTVLLSGCWDAKEPQSVNFITALGIDYVKGEYMIYAQVLAFDDISKQESSVSTEESKVWVATGKGETISKALMSIYPASQQQTLWTHVKAIVLSKSLLDSKLAECLNSLLRSSELRYTPWVYGTDQDIPAILSGISLLNQSALSSELMDPREVYKQLSTIEPLRLIKLMNGIREPASTVCLPSIKLTDQVWSSKEKPISLVRLDGAYIISKGENKGHLDDGLLNGARWIAFKNMYRYPLLLKIKDGGQAQINILNSKPLVKVRFEGEKAKFTVKIKVKATVSEVTGHPEPNSLQIKEAAVDQIKKQIRNDFLAAKAKNIDIYGIEDILYRRFNKQWKKMTTSPEGQGHLLSSLQLEDTDVEVTLMHSSTYKLRYH